MTTAPHILVLTDDPVHHRPPDSMAYVIQALDKDGLPYTLVDDDVAKFEEALTGDEWDLVIMANDVLKPTKTVFGTLDEYVRKGGRLIIHTWAMAEVPDEPLWETLGVKYVDSFFVPSREQARPLYWWEEKHPVFNVPNEKVPMFLDMGNPLETEWPVEHLVDPFRDFIALAGYDGAPTEGAAGLVASPLGVTVFRGFVDFINEADANKNEIPDSVELWQNLINFVLTADPRPAAFSKTAPANSATDVTLDVLLDWAPSAGSSRYAYCIDTSNDTICDTGWHLSSVTNALVKDLAPNTDHYWQVRADNLYGMRYANSSIWWHFTTGNAPGNSNFLPILLREACSSFASSREIEPNDTGPQANGPLCFGLAIAGDPNDPGKPPGAADLDYFSINWSGTGTLHVDVSNFLYDAQVILKDSSYAELDKKYWQPDGHYVIDYPGTGVAGTYYVLVFAPDDHPTDSGDYTLTISN